GGGGGGDLRRQPNKAATPSALIEKLPPKPSHLVATFHNRPTVDNGNLEAVNGNANKMEVDDDDEDDDLAAGQFDDHHELRPNNSRSSVAPRSQVFTSDEEMSDAENTDPEE